MSPEQLPLRGAFLGPVHTVDTFEIRPDCRHFAGERPCRHWRPCHGCPHHDPVDHRVLIVMLGLLGDMLIASPLPARIRAEKPGAHITWLVDEACAPILRMNPYVDEVLLHDWEAAAQLPSRRFDAVYSFERTPSAAALVDRIDAGHKAGLAFGGPHHALYPMGEAAMQFFRQNTWNDYRTIGNQQTWTELYFAVAGYPYAGEPYVLEVPEAARRRVAGLLGERTGPRVCLNLGGSLPTKLWPARHWAELADALIDHGAQLAVLGGPSDRDACEALVRHLRLRGADESRVAYAPLSLEEAAALPGLVDVVVTGDSFGFHLALAHKKPAVLLLGPSNGAEVIPKHVTNVTALRSTLVCSPCAHQVACGGVGGCMDTINVPAVFKATLGPLTTD
ncbi:ADP-heptose:LPS heptosyltransferase [Streptomyces achromogenes]|uniref:ADP-heptose:LPS heptosyltransferase n=1 Tax=Streptomyces achromogenes TaxID=67255 RepID=A0ABU0QBW2_STRAH|nr:ADP-heptose:LPS heptosyltransferase [Streptomyces achromogenes]